MSSHAHESGADQRLETALQTLRDHQHRITGPRRALLAILIGEHGNDLGEEVEIDHTIEDARRFVEALRAGREIVVEHKPRSVTFHVPAGSGYGLRFADRGSNEGWG